MSGETQSHDSYDADAPERPPSRPLLGTLVRAIAFRALPIICVALLIALCAGVVPPWRVTAVLTVGSLLGVGLIFARWRAAAAITGVTTVLVAWWLVQFSLDIRAATTSDPVRERYFGIDTESPQTQIRNLAVATGTFTLDDRLSAALYHVKAAEIVLVNRFSVGRSPNQIGAPYWMPLRIFLALGDQTVPAGRITNLGSAGHSRGGGVSGPYTNDVRPLFTRLEPGKLTPGEKRILYVEGDREITLASGMTLDEFARQNRGNYLVVEVAANYREPRSD